MGILQALGMVSGQLAVAEAVGLSPVGTHAVSEGAVRQLDSRAAVAFGIGTESARVTRAQAMRVPSIRRGRNLVAGTIGTLPLVCTRTRDPQGQAVEAPVERRLLVDLDPRATPSYTLTWTVDDLMFHGIAWWRVTARDSASWPTAVERLKPGRVTVQAEGGQVYVDGQPVDDDDLIRFDGPDEGVLENGSGPGGVLPLALALQSSAKRTADDDVPTVLLRPEEGAPELSPTEVDELLDEWEAARRQRRSAYANRAIKPETVAFDASSRQLTELSEFCSTELARLLNLPASRVNAPAGGSSLTYSTVEGDRRDLVDTTLRLYLTPIEQRLSMRDVTPYGQRVTFDLTAYLRGDVTQTVTAGIAAIGAGLADAPEVRTRWLGLPARTDLQPAPAPAAPPAPAIERTPEQ